MGDLGKIIDDTGFEKLPKVQKIAQSGVIVCDLEDLLAQSQFMTF